MATMDKLNNDIAKTAEKLKQLKREKRGKVQRENKKRRDIDDRRKYILAGIAIKYCPELLELKPPRTKAEEYIVFAPWANFLSCLFARKELVAELKEEARLKTERMIAGREMSQEAEQK